VTSKARVAAFHALQAVAGGRVDLPAALARSRSSLDDERDRALAMDIVTGTTRWQRALDHLIEHFAGRPLARLDVEIVTILRLSLYQLLHLSRVPASAVVDEAVNLARYARKPSASGFVNAVLRSTARQRQHLPFPARPASPDDREGALTYLGVTHSHPDWLVERWLDRYGLNETERWVQFNNQAAPLTLRANRLRTSRELLQQRLEDIGVETSPTPFAPDGLHVTTGNPLAHAHGDFVVQDEASQLVALAVCARPGEVVLDLCAAPGGKTLAMAADMENRGLVVACDVRDRRVRLLRDTVAASGASNVRLAHVDTRASVPFRGAIFDRVLVDAPCSGLGTVRRDPDIKWRRREDDLDGFAERQRALLARAAAVVKPGGRLVYATCSSEPDENEQVVDSFLAAHPAFAIADLRPEQDRRVAALIDERGFLRTSPLQGLEAFFAASLVRHH
jgi:16S rRNA (cytosine967-C5)-methyltransferase